MAHNCHGKIKFRTTNWNYFRQTTNIHGKNKIQSSPGRVDRVVLHHVLGRPLTKNRWPPLWLLPWAIVSDLFLPWAICFCREEFWIVSTVFVFAVNVCSLSEVISICCSEFYFLVLIFILPWQLWATVDQPFCTSHFTRASVTLPLTRTTGFGKA